jgi:hypothetical protein
LKRRGASPEPTTPDIELFGDNACTTNPTGSLSVIYARVNKAWNGVDSGWRALDPTDGTIDVAAGSPTTEHPNNPYNVIVGVESGQLSFESPNRNQPLTDGTILRLQAAGPHTFDGSPIVFYKP